ncbi:hypothetical protein Mgra_00000206 [Meloidogyne graminicola]|uniref:Cadherin domain-containing protein n=1 Tax=Meloidogyne graminicola TaxID=189291 RepID=A0A8T0A4W3_9BILA|nr:hypothetical protein Mgra_00000206 [Meloidogyne graminicola]
MKSLSNNRLNKLFINNKNCSKLFVINSLSNKKEKENIELFYLNLNEKLEENLINNNCQNLEIIAEDNNGQKDKINLKINIENNNYFSYHFTNSIYERSLNINKIYIGTPIIQLQLSPLPPKGNPGWLAIEQFNGNIFVNKIPKELLPNNNNNISIKIAAIDREKHLILAKTQLNLEINGNNNIKLQNLKKCLSLPIIQLNVEKEVKEEEYEVENDDEENKNKLNNNLFKFIKIFEDLELSKNLKLNELKGWNNYANEINIDKDSLIYFPKNGTIRLNFDLLKTINSLHAKFILNNSEKEEEKCSILLTILLKFDSNKLIKRFKKLSRARFVAPWKDELTIIKLKIPEELPIGHPLIRLPAYNPLKGIPVNVTLEGLNADSFNFDLNSGEIKIAKRLDFENSPSFQRIYLIANSSESDKTVRANIEFELIDIDDIPPKIKIILNNEEEEKRSLNNSISSNIQIHVNIINKHYWSIYIAENVQLDREQQKLIGLVLNCIDNPGQNIEEIGIIIELIDLNDNKPIINWAHQEEKYLILSPSKNKGTAITRFWAFDRDEGENGHINFKLDDSSENSLNDFFQIDKQNGLLISSNIRPLNELYEMLGGEIFELKVLAIDNGYPPLSSIAKINIIFTEELEENKKELKIIWPNIEDKPLELKEDIPIGRIIGQVKAIFIGKKLNEENNEIIYKIENKNKEKKKEENEIIIINNKTGELFINSELDYERKKELIYLIIAYSPKTNQTIKCLLPIIIINVDEHLPYFPHSLKPTSSKLIIYWPNNNNSNEEFPLGNVEAIDEDSEPFNQIEYTILNKCSTNLPNLFNNNSIPSLRIDKQSGEILAIGSFPKNINLINICILASSPLNEQQINLNNIPLKSLINIQIIPELNNKNKLITTTKLILNENNNTHLILEHKLAKLQKIPINIQINEEQNKKTKIEINSVLFTPYGKNITQTQRIGFIEPLKRLIGIDQFNSKFRFDPAVMGALNDGFYRFKLKEENEEEEEINLYKNIHFLSDRNRLRFIFNESIHQLGKLERIIETKYKTNNNNNNIEEEYIKIINSEPIKEYNNNNNKLSSFCFHLWSNINSIINLNKTIKYISTNIPGEKINEELIHFYKQNNVINIEPCFNSKNQQQQQKQYSFNSFNKSSLSYRSKEWLFWCCITGIILIVLIGLGVYLCFVKKYGEDNFNKKINNGCCDYKDSSPFQQYLINNKCTSSSVFSVPEFIQAKSIMNTEYWKSIE